MRRRPVAHRWLLAAGVWHAAVWLLTWPCDRLLRAELRRLRAECIRYQVLHTEEAAEIAHLLGALRDVHGEMQVWKLRVLEHDAGER